MHLDSVTSSTDDLEQASRFYAEVLGLPVRSDQQQVAVTIGSTQLHLEHHRAAGVVDHLAITIPADTFADARRWLTQRVPLYSLGGKEEFEGPPSWESRSLYFPGPSRSVLELIARRRLPASGRGEPFGPQHLLHLSEVGVAVPDVSAAVAELRDKAGLDVFGEGLAPDFAAVGDDEGLLILAAEGRTWFPTADLRATASPSTLSATGAVRVHLHLGSTQLQLTPG